jgi:N-acetylmuramic acid 6-phosphate etherase
MPDAIEKANRFLTEEKAFRLGILPTEASHPKTEALSQTAQTDLRAAVAMLQSVDADIPPVAEKVFQDKVFQELVDAFVQAMEAGNRIYFTGCGATGRLAILLEAAWRRFWGQCRQETPERLGDLPDLTDRIVSVMAGGDYALIKAVEGFEDFPDFGRYQLKQAGVKQGDVVVAVTEGGETPFVIGTAWQGLDAGAKVFFVYNNPTEALCRHVRRSREVIEEPRIRRIDLATGPMAITGSTRMQAVTIELLVLGGALEMALARLLREHHAKLPAQTTKYSELFSTLLTELSASSAIQAMIDAIVFEEDIYRRDGLITYVADSFLLDVLTDTTERSPTFMLPPFRKLVDKSSPRPWAFVKDPFRPTRDAWRSLLSREPRGLQWDATVYEQLSAPTVLLAEPPQLGNDEIYKFQIGCEPDVSRTDVPDSAMVAIAVGDEVSHIVPAALKIFGTQYNKTAAILIGPTAVSGDIDGRFVFTCDLPDSPLQLWHHLAVKLVLNTISTVTMVRMGRVLGNAMVWVSPSNKKLIDRGCRLISQVTGCSYEKACTKLHQTMDEVESRSQQGQNVPSPVALAIEQLKPKNPSH